MPQKIRRFAPIFSRYTYFHTISLLFLFFSHKIAKSPKILALRTKFLMRCTYFHTKTQKFSPAAAYLIFTFFHTYWNSHFFVKGTYFRKESLFSHQNPKSENRKKCVRYSYWGGVVILNREVNWFAQYQTATLNVKGTSRNYTQNN